MPNNSDKSNAEVAREIVARCLTLSDIENMGAQSLGSLVEGIESALTRAQSQLAEKVLAEIQDCKPELHWGSANGSMMKKCIEVTVRDLFKRLNVSVEEGE